MVKEDTEKESKSKKTSSEKEKESHAPQEEILEKMILNSQLNKYDVIQLTRRWAYELKSKDDQARSVQELITQSLKDILSNRVTCKMVQNLLPLVLTKKHKNLPAPVLDNIGKAPVKSSSEANPEKTKDAGSKKKKS